MAMIEFDNQTNLEVDISLAKTILESISDKTIELLIVDKETMREINSQSRQIDEKTDVLSFPLDLEVGTHLPLGSIVICDWYLIHNAQQYNHTHNDEFILLFIHGLLHLIGYDHENDKGEMRQKEEELIRKYNLPSSLIVRTEQ